MTKKEWSNLRVGHTIYCKSLKFDKSGTESKLVRCVLKGEVIEFNSNSSQCKIKFEDGIELWRGRLGIEINVFEIQK